MDAHAGVVQHELLPVHAVVDEDVDRAAHADEELLAGAVRMLPTDVLAGHVVDEEGPLRDERQVGELGRHQAAPHVDRLAQSLQPESAGRRVDGSDRHQGGRGRRLHTGVAHDPARVADDDGVRRHVPRDDGADTDHRVPPDGDAREARAVGSELRPVLDDGLRELLRVRLAAREAVVGEGDVRADEDVVAEADAVPQLHAALDGDAVTHDDVVLDEHVVTDVAVRAEPRARENVRERPHLGARSDRRGLADALLVNEVVHSFPSAQPSGCMVPIVMPCRHIWEEPVSWVLTPAAATVPGATTSRPPPASVSYRSTASRRSGPGAPLCTTTSSWLSASAAYSIFANHNCSGSASGSFRSTRSVSVPGVRQVPAPPRSAVASNRTGTASPASVKDNPRSSRWVSATSGRTWGRTRS